MGDEKFYEMLKEWKQHILNTSFSSNPNDYIDCDAFRGMVALGIEALPLIREEYSKPQRVGDPGQFWAYAVSYIEPEFRLEISKSGNGPVSVVNGIAVAVSVAKVRDTTLKWLDDYLS